MKRSNLNVMIPETKTSKKNNHYTVNLNFKIDLTECDSTFLATVSPHITDSKTLDILAKYVISHPNSKDFYDIKINIIENPYTKEDTLIYFAEHENNEFVKAHIIEIEHTIFLTNLLAKDPHWYVIKTILAEDTFLGLSRFENIIDRLVNDELILPNTKNDFEDFLTTIYEHEYMKKDAYLREMVENKISTWVEA